MPRVAKPNLPYVQPGPWANFPAQLQYYSRSEAGLGSVLASDTSGNLTDLSLRSRGHTAGTSAGTPALDGRAAAKTSANDGSASDNSASDNSASLDSGFANTPGPAGMARKDSDLLSLSSSASVSKLNGAGEQLSWANMKEHDRQWAELSHNHEHVVPVDGPVDGPAKLSLEDRADSLSDGYRRRRKRRLPTVSSSLDRSFPLPNPQQIEMYSQQYDSVDLDTRSTSPQNSSSSG
ncbi:hypothetical protein METBIDRAFT_29948 [Metschnikowia bicuspidata var. bicuspidata NRRL YB-4993]|uniref:Uncharacterized protein n=1 Tax=Metschnikowia bicuspidata var. bicuspidata NRRL YB-4993 TaxID=869754 RepID=A0A1A0HHL5_9ASCO|nr:hypothetical protein METBIDRAFT_29948 [Metschnikowia bicuspidata var. bicuspidata NRRL YB-4993]OBA23496.1 hypothetical protein METBIDRAFT_29948 [Metschnikowia bicuspidata var. bicuspidata NRRL YB-4993]